MCATAEAISASLEPLRSSARRSCPRRREQAKVELAFRRKPRARAGSAERARDARNHADFAAAVRVAPALRGFGGAVGLERREREVLGDPRHDFGGRQHFGHVPTVRRADIHVFDKAQHAARAFEVTRHRHDFRVVRAALDHHVDLDRREADRLGRGNAFQHVVHREVGVVHVAKQRVVDRVEAYRHAGESGVLEAARLAGEQRAIGGEREIERAAFRRGELREPLDQEFQVLAQQRFAAGQADFFHAMRDEEPGQPFDFLEAQQRAMRQERVILVEHRPRHAVDAAEIAAIRHRDAQIPQRARQGVAQHAAWRLHGAGDDRHRADIGNRDDASGHGRLDGAFKRCRLPF